MKTELTNIIKERAERILKRYSNTFDAFNLGTFYMAGNSLNNISGRVTDIDLFVNNDAKYREFRERLWVEQDLNSIAMTKNAITLREQDRIFQVCSYTKDSLEDLIHSFDYTHIQVGVEIRLVPLPFGSNDYLDYRVHKVFYTDAYITAQAAGNSQYVGSDYPLSSLLRASKYFKYGEMSRSKLIQAVLLTVKDVAARGFKDYEDFKDQLDAVDLGLLPEDMNDMEHNALMELFEALRKDK